MTTTQHTQAWEAIRQSEALKQRQSVPFRWRPFIELFKDIKNLPMPTLQGRRSVKNRGMGVGQILKSSHVQGQVNMEAIFLKH